MPAFAVARGRRIRKNKVDLQPAYLVQQGTPDRNLAATRTLARLDLPQCLD
jgi:hypothetical protein